MTTADYNVLTNLCISISKIIWKIMSSIICHNSRVPCILYIFVHIVYSTSCTIQWFERNKLNWIKLNWIELNPRCWEQIDLWPRAIERIQINQSPREKYFRAYVLTSQTLNNIFCIIFLSLNHVLCNKLL